MLRTVSAAILLAPLLVLAQAASAQPPPATELPKVLTDCLKAQPNADALTACTRAINNRGLAPELKARAYFRRGRVRISMSETAQGIADLDAAARVDPNDSAYPNEACWQRTIKDIELEVALGYCDAAVRICLDKPECGGRNRDSRALVYLKQKRPAEAYSDYDAAMQVKANAHHQYGRGIAAIRLGRVAEGQADVAAANRLDPVVGGVYAGFGIRP